MVLQCDPSVKDTAIPIMVVQNSSESCEYVARVVVLVARTCAELAVVGEAQHATVVGVWVQTCSVAARCLAFPHYDDG